MSRDFVKARYNSESLEKAAKQEQFVKSLTISKVQENVSQQFVNNLVKNGTAGEEPLFQWVSAILKKDNYRSFLNYTRFPLVSTALVSDIIKKMNRVFFSDDAFQKYQINGQDVIAPEYLKVEEWEQTLYKAMTAQFNDVVVHHIGDNANEPYRTIIGIDKVVSIKLDETNHIHKIAYSSMLKIDDEYVKGTTYLSDMEYAFYPLDSKKYQDVIIPHDIGRCPASFISCDIFDHQYPVIREGLFSRIRPLLEKYVYFDTLQIMSETNGAFPIIVKALTEDDREFDNDQRPDGMHADKIVPEKGHQQKFNKSIMQAGSEIEVEVPRKDDGSYDTSIIENFATFLRSPVDNLEHIKKRIDDIKREIQSLIVGDYYEPQETQMNEMQVSKSYISKQDMLRALSSNLSESMTKSNEIMMLLANGQNIMTQTSFGSDFFIETADDLLKRLELAPNAIEERHVINRLIKVRSINKTDKALRDTLFYALMPFLKLETFQEAVNQNLVSRNDRILQMQFSFVISTFEARYGDIVDFYQSLDGEPDERLAFIRNLIQILITDYANQIETVNPDD